MRPSPNLETSKLISPNVIAAPLHQNSSEDVNKSKIAVTTQPFEKMYLKVQELKRIITKSPLSIGETIISSFYKRGVGRDFKNLNLLYPSKIFRVRRNGSLGEL